MSLNFVDSIPDPPCRPPDAHKGTCGRATLIGGALGMAGAISLSGLAALRSGAGLVFLAVPDPIAAIVAATEPSYQVRGLSSDPDGHFAPDAFDQLDHLLADSSAVGIGPGLGRSAGADLLVQRLVHDLSQPLVLDADALNSLAVQQDVSAVFKHHAGQRILTPHPGEFARLVRSNAALVNRDRESLTVELARELGAVVVLKGPGTVVSDGQRIFVNQTGNNGLATGGSGDVLTGLMVGLLAQGMSAFDAAVLAVHVHGRAADLAICSLSRRGLIASDLPEFIARVWAEMEPGEP